VVLVWVVSAAYAAPRLFFARVTSQALRHSTERDSFCHLDTRRFDPDAFDTANLVLLYVAPLLAMAAMYSRMCVELWRSGRRVPVGAVHAGRSVPSSASTAAPDMPSLVEADPTTTTTTSMLLLVSESGYDGHPSLQSRISCGDSRSLHACDSLPCPAPQLRRLGSLKPSCRGARPCINPQPRKNQGRSWSKFCRIRRSTPTSVSASVTVEPHRRTETEPGPLAARRRVILMLMLVVLSFLLCNLPYHARKMWQARLRSQPSQAINMSFYSKLFTPATFLVMYLNSALNPVLYVTMSRSFRRAMFRRLRLCSRGMTKPCMKCCKTETNSYPSPLIGRHASMRLAASTSSTRGCSVILPPSANGQHNGALNQPETGV
jgi:hypothetical protein